jgi:hypothetical protein
MPGSAAAEAQHLLLVIVRREWDGLTRTTRRAFRRRSGRRRANVPVVRRPVSALRAAESGCPAALSVSRESESTVRDRIRTIRVPESVLRAAVSGQNAPFRACRTPISPRCLNARR